MLLVDAHTHIFAPAQAGSRDELAARDATFSEMYADPNAKMATGPGLLANMDRDGVDVSVVAGFAFAAERDIAEQNEYLLGWPRAAGVESRAWPLATLNLAHAGWRSIAESALHAGARGFGELRPHNQGWDPLGAETRALCGLARDAGVPLLWHVSEPVGHSYPGKLGGISPIELCQLAALEPATKMIAAHLGGGLSFYLQMPEIRATLTSVYFDTAAASLLYDRESIPRLVDLAGPERVLFASDYPLQTPRRQHERILAAVPQESAAAICGQNAMALFSRETVTDRNS
jgi:predicted TIM-barrel fold metal-dependent hydrolase